MTDLAKQARLGRTKALEWHKRDRMATRTRLSARNRAGISLADFYNATTVLIVSQGAVS